MVARGLRLLSVVLLLVLAPAWAQGPAGQDCDDLSDLPATPRVDYQQTVQTIWSIRCSNCHVDHGGTPAMDLDLDPDDSWFALVDRPSLQAPDAMLVEPGQAAASYLFQKVNCPLPAVGMRMPRGRMSIPREEQALVRDWIQQGAREFVVPSLFEDGFEPAPEGAANAH